MPFDPDVEVFPLELFALIVDATRDDRSTLLNLSLVSKSFLKISQRSLYRRVSLGGIKVASVGGEKGRWSMFDISNDTRFFRTLTKTPHLAHQVRDFSFRPDTGHMSEYLWDNFHQALHLMVNLKYLQLTLMGSDRTFYRILEDLCSHPFQLEVFSWKDYRRRMTNQDMVAFLSFLASQPRLRALDVLSSTAALLLPPESCPNLATFVGDYRLAGPVLRGSSVTNFVWMGGHLEPSPLLEPEWAACFSNLRLLVFFDQFPVDVDLVDLVSHLQSLEALQISFESGTVPSDHVLYKATELLQHIPKVQHLRVLTWTGAHPSHWGVSNVGWLEGFKAAANNFFDNPTIQHVYLSCQSGDGERYFRWSREASRGCAIEVDADDLVGFYHGLDFDGSLIDRRFVYGQ
ncbi:hypothetical protein D9756_007334 [Leucocoprinus leucothites]|uniref:Uncharacterized protein n=1 Tax=Leucocoprinus leucothites TaxID=201217 RepID=A0A8H5FZ60_9AGAR|nr:hypothetical protein D9756_007334 [Leucoagaricus leucothites]